MKKKVQVEIDCEGKTCGTCDFLGETESGEGQCCDLFQRFICNGERCGDCINAEEN